MGLLYARCIGSLSANGKYIIPMDSDDMFLDKDVFCVLLNIAIRGNFDIIIYNSISTNLKPDIYNTLIRPTRFDRNHRPNRVLFQPDLGYYPTSPGDKIDQIRLSYMMTEYIGENILKFFVYIIYFQLTSPENYGSILEIIFSPKYCPIYKNGRYI